MRKFEIGQMVDLNGSLYEVYVLKRSDWYNRLSQSLVGTIVFKRNKKLYRRFIKIDSEGNEYAEYYKLGKKFYQGNDYKVFKA